MGLDLGSISASIGLNTAPLTSGIAKAKAEMSRLDSATNKTSGLMHKGFVAAGIATVAGLALVGYGLKQAVDAAAEAQVVIAETNAILTTTGHVANVTSDEIGKLANSIMQKTSYDDEAIRSGANMLLTFTNVRNGVAATDKVFDQALDYTTDLARKFGTDIPAAAKLLGKALQDPVKGVTALRRMGVMLTESQMDQVKAFVASGNIMAAQKVILEEVRTEVGLVAEAYGATLPGKIDLLKANFGELLEQVGNAVLPMLTDMMGKMASWDWEGIGQGIGNFITKIAAIPATFKMAFIQVQQVYQDFITEFEYGFMTLGDILEHIPGPVGKWGTELKQAAAGAINSLGDGAAALDLEYAQLTGDMDAANAAVDASFARLGANGQSMMKQMMGGIVLELQAGNAAEAAAAAQGMNGLITALASGMPMADGNMKSLVTQLESTISSADFYNATTEQMQAMAGAISNSTGVPISTVMALMNTLKGEVSGVDLGVSMGLAASGMPGALGKYTGPLVTKAGQINLAVQGAIGTPLHPVVGGLQGNDPPTLAAQANAAMQSVFDSNPLHPVIGNTVGAIGPAPGGATGGGMAGGAGAAATELDALNASFNELMKTTLPGWSHDVDNATAGFANMEEAIMNLNGANGAELLAWRNMRGELDKTKASVDAYQKSIDASEAKITAYQTTLDALNAKTTAYQATIDAGKAKIEAYQAAIDASKTKITDYEATLSRLSTMKLTGEGATADTSFSQDIESRKLQLQIMNAEDAHNYALAAKLTLQKEVLDRQKQEADLQTGLTYDPQHRALEKLLDPLAQQEMSYTAIVVGINAANNGIAAEERAIKAVELSIAANERAIKAVEKSMKKVAKAIVVVEKNIAKVELGIAKLQKLQDAASLAVENYSKTVDSMAANFLKHYDEMKTAAEALNKTVASSPNKALTIYDKQMTEMARKHKTLYRDMIGSAFKLNQSVAGGSTPGGGATAQTYTPVSGGGSGPTVFQSNLVLDGKIIAKAVNVYTGSRASAISRSGGHY